jgi:sec-independent protein translocase protein TatC
MSADSPDGPVLVADDDDELGQEVDERSRMSFLDHLDELRRRIVYSLYAVIASCLVTFWFVNEMFDYLTVYFQQQGGELIFTQPMAGFMFTIKIGVLSGVIIAAPFVFSQLWLFVAPGLYAREKKVVIPFVISSSILFFSGAYFAHAVGFPAMWRFFASYETESLSFLPDLAVAFSLYVKVLLGLGLVFQMPILVFFLSKFGVITAGFMVRKFKYVVLGIVVIAAAITPSGDAVTLGVFVAPMLLLYVISVGVAWLFGKKRAPAEPED